MNPTPPAPPPETPTPETDAVFAEILKRHTKVGENVTTEYKAAFAMANKWAKCLERRLAEAVAMRDAWQTKCITETARLETDLAATTRELSEAKRIADNALKELSTLKDEAAQLREERDARVIPKGACWKLHECSYTYFSKECNDLRADNARLGDVLRAEYERMEDACNEDDARDRGSFWVAYYRSFQDFIAAALGPQPEGEAGAEKKD